MVINVGDKRWFLEHGIIVHDTFPIQKMFQTYTASPRAL